MTPEQLEAHRVRFEQRYMESGACEKPWIEYMRRGNNYGSPVLRAAWQAYQWALADAQRAAPVSDAVAWIRHPKNPSLSDELSWAQHDESDTPLVYATSQPVEVQPVASGIADLAAETPAQKGLRATLAVAGLAKAFEGLGSGKAAQKTAVSDEMVGRFLMWKLPPDFSPDGGVSFKRESDYEHPVFGRTKHEPIGTNLFHAGQVRAMLEHVLATAQPVALEPLTDAEVETLIKVNHFHENYRLKESDRTTLAWYRLGLRDGERAHGITPTSAKDSK